jgi:IS1 family transposase
MRKIIEVIELLIEGVGVRGISRKLKMDRLRVRAILLAIGLACACLHDRWVRNVQFDYVQVDELWSFVGEKDKFIAYKKEKGIPIQAGVRGSVWTFLAVNPLSNLIISYLMGLHGYVFTHQFIEDLHSRLARRVTLISDGYPEYVKAIRRVFGPDGVDYGIIHKVRNKRGRHIRSDKHQVFGKPRLERITTVDIENQNLHHRMKLRRMQRKTTGHSKIILAHFAVVSLWLVFHNFCRTQDTLGKKTPAMVAGLASEPWSIEHMVHQAVGTLLTSGTEKRVGPTQ